MEIVQWIMGHIVESAAILLALVRLLESIAVVLPKQPKGVLEFIVKTLKEIFRFG
jgi:serine phosphatase RsbU (regulator of sigma subunit)